MEPSEGAPGQVLNPGSSFPLTVDGVDAITFKRLRDALVSSASQGSRAAAKSILPFVQMDGFQCREVDEYIRVFRPQYLAKLEALKSDSREWAAANEDEQEELLESLQGDAAASLDVQPYCDVVALLEPDSYKHAKTVAEVLAHTFSMAGFSSDRSSLITDPDLDADLITGVEISPIGDGATCPHCVRAALTRFSLSAPPTVPLHIGCRCSVGFKTRYDTE